MRSSTLVILCLVFSSCASTDRMPPRDLESAVWQASDTGTEASLRGLCVLDGGVVWASGSGGTVLRSLDGGTTWTHHRVPGPDDQDLRDIEAVDAMTAWVIAITKPARILRTRDGGGTWEELYASADERSFFDSIALFEGGGGVVFGDPRDGVFEILRSEDGERWQPVRATNIPRAEEGEAAFAASGTCVVTSGSRHAWIGTGGRHSRVLRSEDRGHTWSAADSPMPQGGETTGIYGVRFISDRIGITVGGDFTAPGRAENNVAFTEDGGATWVTSRSMPSGYRSAAAPLPGGDDRWVVVGRAGSDLTIDGGATWRVIPCDGYYAVDSSPDGTVVAVGAGGRAARLAVGSP